MRFSGLSAGAAALALSTLVNTVVAKEDPCSVFAKKRGNRTQGLDAKLWLACIKNVPFNQDRSEKTILGLRRMLGLQSSVVYHLNPPAELELQPFNVNKTLDEIEQKVKNKSNTYKSNWEFDYDLVKMFYRFRDGHTLYEPACTHGYQYVHQYPVIAMADNTTGTPEIYHIHKNYTTGSWQQGVLGQKISKINDMPAADYIRDFTKNSPEFFSFVDPDARWNEMMYSLPAGDSRGRFAKRQLWNGEDITLTWANGTKTKVEWTLTLYPTMVKDGKLKFKDTKGLEKVCFLSKKEIKKITPRKPKNKKKKPKKKKVVAAPKKKKAPKKPEGYPQFAHVGPEHTINSFILPKDKKTAVLTIRKFSVKAMDDDKFILAFQKFVKDSIIRWKKDGVERLIIDVTGNGGGKVILPYDVITQFFPQKAAFTSINMRWSPTTWAYMKSIRQGKAADIFTDMDGKDFKNQADWLGPQPGPQGEYFTKRWKQDYMQLAADDYKLDITHNTTQPFSHENIIVVSNGICASACHSFVEGMQEQGVRTVAYGGRPDRTKLMQAVGGTKGGKVLPFRSIISGLKKGVKNATLVDRPFEEWFPPPIPVRLTAATINSENKFRRGSDTPLEFTITPACQRLSITRETFTDVMTLWQQARDAAWDDKGVPKKCMSAAPAIPGRPTTSTTKKTKNLPLKNLGKNKKTAKKVIKKKVVKGKKVIKKVTNKKKAKQVIVGTKRYSLTNIRKAVWDLLTAAGVR
ncbi:hypothetical protein P167DRAFT_567936 [Morchella conica CCBAS932]|uniref:Uncharacterized protein n=1 Tax=Morchella conica CCBAS932 TaxID=1392247 RepID=A0A3N4KDA8_9PEZI|nr:hypothetical protein P167DRAFT_567936 [Morchella conica CCBAS932]